MPFYVFSTLTTDVVYTGWVKGNSDLPVLEKQVLIKGGSNVADKRLFTPLGIMTEVSEEELEVLENDQVFQLHKQNGFIKVEKKKADPERVAGDMKTKDQSAPLTPNDFEDPEGIQVSTGAGKK